MSIGGFVVVGGFGGFKLQLTSWHYSGFGTKLSPIFGFAKTSQIQNHFSIKPNAQIRCSIYVKA
ncbi:hypothetical protein C8C85_1949 [Flavobacterium sp. 103]|nr:hypothetical protein C8C85_1949 [Flavobacterium sp. 103]